MRNKKLWKRVLAGALTAVMTLGLCACGAGGGNTGKKTEDGKTIVTMTYWNPESTQRALLDLLAEKLPDIEVQYNYIANTSYTTTVRTKLLSGSGDDIVTFSDAGIMELATQGVFEEVTDLVKDDFNLADEYYVDGKAYFVPMNTWYEGIYYNKDIFEKHNIEVPTTFDEFLDVCGKLEDAGVKPFTIGAGTPYTLLKNFLGYAQSEYMLQDEGKDFNKLFSKGEIKMADCLTPYMEKWKEICTKGYISSSMLGVDENQAPDEFVTEVAAMWPAGTWTYNTIKQKNINLNFGLMPYLGSKPENASLVGTTGGGYCINAKSKNKEAARRVLEVIASEEGQKALCEGNPGATSLRKGIDLDLPEEYELIRNVLEEGRILCSWTFWDKVGASGKVATTLQSIVSNPSKVNVKEALEEVDQQVETYLKTIE